MKNTVILLAAITLLACQQPKQTTEVESKEDSISSDIIQTDVIVPEHGMADPHAWVHNDTLYIICGHDESWAGKGSFRMDRWEVWSTVDLVNWTFHRNILPSDTYIGDQPNCWAGDICERNGKFYWFFSNRNIDSGVMEADSPTGEYKDILGKPLLPKGIVPVHPYDPEIYVEDGVYTISFGAGTYYMATLAEDMKSLTTEPKPVLVLDSLGNKLGVPDKSTLFKRNDWYYLVYGNKYAMSKNLYGPYDFKGAFLDGGHTSFFDWKGQKYVLQENHDISAFYRGASLKPVFFNEDETIMVPEDDRMYPAPGRPFRFISSTMGWVTEDDQDVNYADGVISGEVTKKGAVIKSAPWLYTKSSLCSDMSFRIKNNSEATELKVALFSRDRSRNFWSETAPVDWTAQEWITIPISSEDEEFKTYELSLSKFSDIKERIMQVAIQPAADASSGSWEIDEVIIK
ncbi:family 43 glycosylhydrolase [Reichenbachiella versicolor]|uniref:family 43 glycosylhydrolase n=1 Tax=Reichenbachiella versicolor TaxID=1821036 RepID=UPI000D6E8639|nr:family 43 glycosylhydrolase [Reichenbachiella versicolor]